MASLHISLSAEKVASIGGFSITNSMLMTWFTMAILILFAYTATRKIKKVPSNLQSIAEIIVDGLYGLFKGVVGEHYIGMFFPLLATLFIFVAVANWGGLLPGVGSIGFFESAHESSTTNENNIVENHETVPNSQEESALLTSEENHEAVADAQTEVLTDEHTQMNNELHTETVSSQDSHTDSESINSTETKVEQSHSGFVPLLRGATADLNTTLGLAILSVLAIQYYGVKSLGISYFKKFLNFSDPIMFGVGILEIVSEFSRILSFAFRLFGNVFAGEVLLTVIAFLMPLFAPLPFIGLELFVGFIQALIFSMLTAVFLNMATVSHGEH